MKVWLHEDPVAAIPAMVPENWVSRT